MTYFTDTFRSPTGFFSTAVDATGAVVATAFGTAEDLHLRFAPDNGMPVLEAGIDASPGRHVREQVLAYWAGERREFALPLAPFGTAFQQQVWAALMRIPFAETRSYGQLAAELGNPAASRAVGRANAANPICLIVPCHRVVGADGSLTGFAFGEEIKRQLLAHERFVATRTRAA